MKRLHEIQAGLSVPKDKKNDFGGYNYRTAEGILTAVKPHLAETEAVILSDDMVMVGDEMFVKATATLLEGTETIASAVSFAMHPKTKKGMDPAQITGSASSYARKYALSGLFAVDDGEGDPDSNKAAYEPEPASENEIGAAIQSINAAPTIEALNEGYVALRQASALVAADPRVIAAAKERKATLAGPDEGDQNAGDAA